MEKLMPLKTDADRTEELQFMDVLYEECKRLGLLKPVKLVKERPTRIKYPSDEK